MRFEYTAIAAPGRSDKSADAKSQTDRYALTLTAELNRMAAEGWDYVRADVLPSEERSGLTGRSTVYHNLLIFRRELAQAPQDAVTTRQQPQPEYPAAASPAQTPEPAPHVPDAAAPRPADHVTGTELGAAAVLDDPHAPMPPAPRESPAAP